MMAADVLRRLSVIGMAIAVLVVPGCGQKPPNFTPSSLSADEAVRRALDAWKAGEPAGAVPGKPVVQVADVGRKPGQTLTSYQILGENRSATGRTVAVLLRLANPEAEIKARYVVIGIDPLWVFRQEDYELLMHWEHSMPEEKPADAQLAQEKATTEEHTEVQSKESSTDLEEAVSHQPVVNRIEAETTNNTNTHE